MDAIPGPIDDGRMEVRALLSTERGWEVGPLPQREERGRALRPLVLVLVAESALASLCFLACCLSCVSSRRQGRRRSPKTIKTSVERLQWVWLALWTVVATVPAMLGLESNRELDVDESSKTINALLPHDTTQPRRMLVRTVENLSVQVACLMRVRTETVKGPGSLDRAHTCLHSGLNWCEPVCTPALLRSGPCL